MNFKMANSVITQYLADPTIPAEKRRKIAEGINSGQLTESAALQGISAKYGDKYGSIQSNKDATGGLAGNTPQEKLGGAIAKKVMGLADVRNVGNLGMEIAKKAPQIAKGLSDVGKTVSEADTAAFAEQQKTIDVERAAKVKREQEVVQGLNRRGIVPSADDSIEKKEMDLMTQKIINPMATAQEAVGDFAGKVAGNVFEGAKSGVLTGAEGVQKVGAAITGNTDQLEEFRSFYGLKSKEQAAADMRTLAPAERGQMFGEGAQNFVSGTVGTAFSPIVGATEALPYGKEALGLVGEGLGAVSQAGSGQFKNLLKNSGIQLSPEQEASIDEGVGNLLNLFLVKAGEDVAKVKATEAVKMKVQTQVPELIKKGDFAGAKALLAEYEAANLAKTTATGRVGAVAGETAGAAATAGARMAGELVKKTAKASGRALKSTGEGIGKVGEGIQSKVSGLDIETINTLKNLPDEFKTAAKEGVEGARTNAFNQIKNVVDEQIADLRSTGKAYETFGEATINVGSFLDDSLRKAGLVIDESGKITTSPSSAIRSAGEINKLQALRDLYKDKEVMTGKEFLNLRSDLGELAKYNQETTPGARLWAKQTRAELNKGFRDQVEGLKEADVANSAIRKDLSAIKGMIYDKAGNIKNGAISKVNNLFNKGKEQQLAVLEKIIPDFEKFKSQVKVTKALEDVERASGVKVGTYANGILAGGGGAMVGGPVGAVVGMILTNPKVVAGLLLKYGELKKMSKGVIESITNKIIGGKDLTKTEAALTGDMIQHFAKQDTAVPPANASGGVTGSQPISKANTFQRAKNLSSDDRKVESKAFEKIEKQEDKLLQQYESKNGKIVNVDSFRPLFAKEGYVGRNAAAVQEPSSYLAKKMYTKLLNNDGGFVVATGGGSGAGKTSGLKNIPEFLDLKDKSAVILDSNLSTFDSAVKKIKEAEDKGKVFVEFYVYRDPIDAFTNGVIKRMKENTEETGRLVPSRIVAQNTLDSFNVAKKLDSMGKEVYYVDNSLGKNKSALTTAQEIGKKIRGFSVDGLIKEFNKIALNLYKNGKIKKQEYQELIR